MDRELIEFTLTSAGAHRIRFAISPLDQALAALRVALHVHTHPAHGPWLQASKVRSLPITELLSALRDPHYVCEFLSPPPDGPDTTAAAQLTVVRRTPPAQVAKELAVLDTDLRELPLDPAKARDLLANQLEISWHELIAPHWPSMRDILQSDIAYRSNKLAAGGFAAVIESLHPSVRLVNRGAEDVLVVRSTTRARLVLDRRGLLLVPSMFTWSRVGVIAVPPWQPSILYPARGVGGFRAEGAAVSDSALVGVVGRTKAAVLTALDEPMTTSALARCLGLARGTVSEHLMSLRDGGLLTTTRRGRSVLYSRSALGAAFVQR